MYLCYVCTMCTLCFFITYILLFFFRTVTFVGVFAFGGKLYQAVKTFSIGRFLIWFLIDNSKLVSAVLPTSLVVISNGAFLYCFALSTITIPT